MPARSPGFSIDRPGRRANSHTKLVGNHIRQRGLAETGRAVQQDVIEGFAALPGSADGHVEILADPILPDVLVEPARPQSRFD